MTRIIFFLLLLSFSLFGQTDFKDQNFKQILFSEVHLIPSGSLNLIYYSYKIPNNHLIFLRNGNVYNAEYRIAIEVVDSLGKFVTRQSKEEKLAAGNYEETNANDNYYSEGFIKFELPAGKYKLLPIYTDLNSGRELKLKPVEIITNKEKIRFHQPIVINSEKVNCNEEEKYILSNFGNNIPFDEKEYSIIFPIADKEIKQVFVQIINNKDTIYNGELNNSFSSGISFKSCEGNIILNNSNDSVTTNFVMENISRDLYEGNLLIYISDKKDFVTKERFNLSVKWLNKPASLNKPEFAVKILKYLANEEQIKELLKADDEEYNEKLFEFWKKYDPTPSTTYNPLMHEYYSRVDYSAENFFSITGRNGVDTDRGKIYIQFGKPKKVERSSNDEGKVIETWIYEKNDMRFVFIDERGTGDFSLKNG